MLTKTRSEYIYSTTATFTRTTGSIRSITTKYPIVQYPEDNPQKAYVYNILKVNNSLHEKYLRTITRRMLGIKRVVSMSEDPTSGVFAVNVLTLTPPNGKQKSKILNYLAKIAENRISMYLHISKSAREVANKLYKTEHKKSLKQKRKAR